MFMHLCTYLYFVSLSTCTDDVVSTWRPAEKPGIFKMSQLQLTSIVRHGIAYCISQLPHRNKLWKFYARRAKMQYGPRRPQSNQGPASRTFVIRPSPKNPSSPAAPALNIAAARRQNLLVRHRLAESKRRPAGYVVVVLPLLRVSHLFDNFSPPPILSSAARMFLQLRFVPWIFVFFFFWFRSTIDQGSSENDDMVFVAPVLWSGLLTCADWHVIYPDSQTVPSTCFYFLWSVFGYWWLFYPRSSVCSYLEDDDMILSPQS
jgi:hypothetical protein